MFAADYGVVLGSLAGDIKHRLKIIPILAAGYDTALEASREALDLLNQALAGGNWKAKGVGKGRETFFEHGRELWEGAHDPRTIVFSHFYGKMYKDWHELWYALWQFDDGFNVFDLESNFGMMIGKLEDMRNHFFTIFHEEVEFSRLTLQIAEESGVLPRLHVAHKTAIEFDEAMKKEKRKTAQPVADPTIVNEHHQTGGDTHESHHATPTGPEDVDAQDPEQEPDLEGAAESTPDDGEEVFCRFVQDGEAVAVFANDDVTECEAHALALALADIPSAHELSTLKQQPNLPQLSTLKQQRTLP